MDNYLDDSIVEMFYFETEQLIEQMDRAVLQAEQSGGFTTELVNEILRAMHTIKGSAATMKYTNIAELAHALEDVFHYMREHPDARVDESRLADLVLEGSDLIKVELVKLKNGDLNDGDVNDITHNVKLILADLKNGQPTAPAGSDAAAEPVMASNDAEQLPQSELGGNMYYAHLFFDDGAAMENVRAFTVVHHLREMAEPIRYVPADIIENESSAETIRNDGFQIWFRSAVTDEELHQFFSRASNVKSFELSEWHEEAQSGKDERSEGNERRSADEGSAHMRTPGGEQQSSRTEAAAARMPDKDEPASVQQSIISVNVSKLDKLMDLVGELVIAEAMVTQNPDLQGLQLDNFMKSARQLQNQQRLGASVVGIETGVGFQHCALARGNRTGKLD